MTMQVFFDTNVLIDLLDHARKGNKDAVDLIRVVRTGSMVAYMSAQSIIDASYVLTEVGETQLDDFRSAIDVIMRDVRIVGINDADIESANKCSISDYEDAAQLACALRNNCDVIVSGDRNIRDHSVIPVLNSKEFLQKVLG